MTLKRVAAAALVIALSAGIPSAGGGGMWTRLAYGQQEHPWSVVGDPSGPLVERLIAGRRLAAEGIAAYREGDEGTFVAKLDSALAMRPGHPGLVYNLAAAKALTHDTAGALALLSRLADWELSYDPAADPEFGGLSGVSEFQMVRRRLLENARSRGTAVPAYTLDDPTILPEGIAWDPTSGSLILAGIRHRRILRLETGEAPTLLVDGAAEGMPPPLGLAIDSERRALWISGTWVDVTEPPSDTTVEPQDGTPPVPKPQVREYDLDSGALRRVLAVPSLPDAAVADLAVDFDGQVLVSDWRIGALYRSTAASDTLAIVLPPGTLGSPQCIVPLEHGSGAWIADHALGLVRADFRDGSVEAAETWTTLLGLDGMVAEGNHLYAVQNGVRPERVLRIDLSTDRRRVEAVSVILSAHPEFAEPSGVALRDGALLVVANGQWSRFENSASGGGQAIAPPVILRVEDPRDQRSGQE